MNMESAGEPVQQVAPQESAEVQESPSIKQLQEAQADLTEIIKAYPVGERTPEEERDIQIIAQQVENLKSRLNKARVDAGYRPVEEALGESRVPTSEPVHVDEHYMVTTPEEHQKLVAQGDIAPSTGGRVQ